jgi:hypothetical protein
VVKFWRAGNFNMKTGEELYTCSELQRTKCPCMDLVIYFKKVDKSVPLPPPSNVPSARDETVLKMYLTNIIFYL